MRPNQYIIGTLSFLKLLWNWWKRVVRNFSVCCGAIWGHREKLQYGCTTTIPPVHNGPMISKFGKFTSCMTCDAHKLVRPQLLLDYLYEFWQLLSALYSDVWKKIYIGVHLHSRPQTTAFKFLSNLSAIYTKWSAQTFLPIFGLFTIFDCNYNVQKMKLKLMSGRLVLPRWWMFSSSIPLSACNGRHTQISCHHQNHQNHHHHHHHHFIIEQCNNIWIKIYSV